MKRFTIICVMLAVLLVTATLVLAAPVYVPIDSTSNGLVCLRYGRVLPPPYIFETDDAYSDIYIRVDHDPEFSQLGVARLPFIFSDPSPLRPIANSRTVTNAARSAERRTVDSLAFAAYRHAMRQGHLRGQALAAAERVYTAHGDLLDSIRTTPHSIIRYWRGSNGSPHITSFVPHVTNQAPVDPLAVIRKYVAEKITDLNSGQVLVVGPGGMVRYSDLTPQAFISGLDSLQRGYPSLPEFKGMLRRELEHLKTADEITRLSRGGR